MLLQKEHLSELVRLQRCLIAAFQQLHQHVQDNRWLLGIPTKSELQVGTERWDVAKHGAGLRFTRREPAPHLVVDIHEEAHDPERIDAWRVQQFLESLGIWSNIHFGFVGASAGIPAERLADGAGAAQVARTDLEFAVAIFQNRGLAGMQRYDPAEDHAAIMLGVHLFHTYGFGLTLDQFRYEVIRWPGLARSP